MLSDRIRGDLVAALKAGAGLRVTVLRMVLSALGYKKIELQRELTEKEEIAVVQSEAKKRQEAIEAFRTGDRKDQEEQEKQELTILEEYLAKEQANGEV